MWNHPFRTGHHQTPLSLEEMRRLVGYLVATQFFEERGDPNQAGGSFKASDAASAMTIHRAARLADR